MDPWDARPKEALDGFERFRHLGTMKESKPLDATALDGLCSPLLLNTKESTKTKPRNHETGTLQMLRSRFDNLINAPLAQNP
jgi:hypothetical protein